MKKYMKMPLTGLTCQLKIVFVLFVVTILKTLPGSHCLDDSLKVIYAVNVGGDEHTDRNGIHYKSDPLHNKVGIASDYGKHLLIIGRAPEQDEILYRTERYHTSTFGYNIPLDGDGDYALILKFCEVYFNEPNMKVFDVVLNGKHTIVSELDIFHQVGRGTAHEEYAFFIVSGRKLYFKDEVSDIEHGFIRLDFIKGRYDNPKVNALVLLKGDVQKIPRLSPISDEILPIDADMAVFHDRVSADTGGTTAAHKSIPALGKSSTPMKSLKEQDLDVDFEDTEKDLNKEKHRKTSGPRQPDPYILNESSFMLPIFIAIGAFIPLLFCLCKL